MWDRMQLRKPSHVSYINVSGNLRHVHTTALKQTKNNMDKVSPNIFVTDIKKTITFYKQLGFNVVTTVPEQGDIVFAMMTCGNVTFMFQTFESLGNDLSIISRQNGGSLLLYIQTTEIRKFFDQVKDKVKVVKGLEKTFYGATEFSIEDINGYLLTFAEDEK
jgi:uncharacterized glyoxalase superfamily protein PhnB